MKLDYDIKKINNNKIELLDCQIELILNSLEFYSYTYQFIYPRAGKSRTKEENLRVCMVRDTYHQILSQYKNENFQSLKDEVIKDFEGNFEKVA